MERAKFVLAKQKVTLALFATAVVLLCIGGVGSAQAALTYFSEDYVTHVEMQNIGVTLLENGTRVAWRDYISENNWDETNTQLPDEVPFVQPGNEESESDYVYVYRGAEGRLLEHMLDSDERLKPGVSYDERLTVQNTGTINQFVRVTVTKYWVDEQGNKRTDVSPSLIDLNLKNIGGDWLLDEEASTPERTVLYYSHLLEPARVTSEFADTLTINKAVSNRVTQTESTTGDGTVITTTYDYDGLTFCVEACVEAVQDHNAEDAAKSAWGANVVVSGDRLSLA
ncbi:hypothetical protein [Adlercreutzia sp. ZJ141]|uniref:hypothetical protein n=1 Tax=Adlercreutzia sp. ZJ141 TaxID=2709406 RepID=UPI0013EBD35E|nr:hypothetical protein [Adlercreutzia sp. ZJ141]